MRPSPRQLESRQRLWQAEVTHGLPELLAELLAADDCASSPPRSHGIYLFSEHGTPMYVGRTGKTERSIAKGGGHSNFRTRRAAHTHALRDRLREEGNSKEVLEKTTPTEKQPKKTKEPQTRLPVLAPVVDQHPGLFPLAIFVDYRGTHIEAVVEDTGLISLGSETFTSPSMAAVAARTQHGYGGAGKAQTNGWTFWRFTDTDGLVKPLSALRSAA